MKNNYFLITFCVLLLNTMTYGQEAKFFIDFETTNALSNLPSNVTNVDGANTVRVKNTTDYPATPNVVQTDPDAAGENELFLDYHGYLKMDLDVSNGYSLALDYRRSPEDADWYLGFLTQIGNNAGSNSIERIKIARYWEASFDFNGTESSWKGVNIDNNTHIVITVNSTGDVKIYQNNVEILAVTNATSGKNLTNWTAASLLLSFNGGSYDGTNVTPEPDYASNARDTRASVDNIALFERELSSTEVTQLFNNGNDNLGVLSLTDNNFINNSIKLYPNPLNSSVNELSISSSKVKSVEIYNILGAKVMSKKITNSRINISTLAKGTYVIKCFDVNGKNMDTVRAIKI